jgi:hypothetical protein
MFLRKLIVVVVILFAGLGFGWKQQVPGDPGSGPPAVVWAFISPTNYPNPAPNIHQPLPCHGTAIPFPAPAPGTAHNFTVEMYWATGPLTQQLQSSVTGLSTANQWHGIWNATVPRPKNSSNQDMNWLPGVAYAVNLHEGVPATLANLSDTVHVKFQ